MPLVRFILRMFFAAAFRVQDQSLRRAVKRVQTQAVGKGRTEKQLALHARLRAELEAQQARAL